MRNIFVVERETGEYSDRCNSIICAFSDESEADEYVKQLEAVGEFLKEHFPAWISYYRPWLNDNPQPKTPWYDPNVAQPKRGTEEYNRNVEKYNEKYSAWVGAKDALIAEWWRNTVVANNPELEDAFHDYGHNINGEYLPGDEPRFSSYEVELRGQGWRRSVLM